MRRSLGLSPLLLVILCCAVLIGAFTYGYLYVIKPLNDDIAENQSKITNTKLQVQLKQAQLKQVQDVNIQQLLATVPNNNQFDHYLMILNDVAANSRCRIRSIEAADKTGSDDASNTSLQVPSSVTSSQHTLKVTANHFSDMMAFIHGLETLNRLTDVTALQFSGSKKGPVSFTVTIVTFYDSNMSGLETPKVNVPFINSANKKTPF
ncbi:hypothetical protein JOD43_000665 [Pullulanibacillus pueri]|uniref:Tfp pilus assembly protein PilO n=1 Tax=Pullulanibacillus pueri TaxID=1437324 RepID=A0A8J3ENF9_9BACL|nr:type 4a pilus biogenesis protein PilO [Pullulanibacillus pueri]MBM7680503.1 hypothetical protein [Pullulanibacillus pueri]GGH86049.1 hypothetical protein GCM10007096_32850 [Pullulanibacillus pueri]